MTDTMLDIDTKPTEDISVREVFGLDTDMVVKGFADGCNRFRTDKGHPHIFTIFSGRYHLAQDIPHDQMRK